MSWLGTSATDELVIILVRGIGLGAVFSPGALSFNVVHTTSTAAGFAATVSLVTRRQGGRDAGRAFRSPASA